MLSAAVQLTQIVSSPRSSEIQRAMAVLPEITLPSNSSMGRTPNGESAEDAINNDSVHAEGYSRYFTWLSLGPLIKGDSLVYVGDLEVLEDEANKLRASSKWIVYQSESRIVGSLTRRSHCSCSCKEHTLSQLCWTAVLYSGPGSKFCKMNVTCTVDTRAHRALCRATLARAIHHL